MKADLGKIKEIFDRAPIGYYLKREVSSELSNTSHTSYYDPDKDLIVVAMNNIVTAIEKIGREPKDDLEYEEFVRAPLYHEVSHAIITPVDSLIKSMRYHKITGSEFSSVDYYISEAYKQDHEEKPTMDVVEKIRKGNIQVLFNIVEDERIETIFNNYYMYVNFKKFVFLACDYEECKKARETDPMALFFSVVRFREGPEEFVKRLKLIISRARLVGRYNDKDSGLVREEGMYLAKILVLYYDIVEYLKSKSGSGDGSGSDKKDDGEKKDDEKGSKGSKGTGDAKGSGSKSKSDSDKSDKDDEKESAGKSETDSGDKDKGEGESDEIEEKIKALEEEISEECDKINKDGQSQPMGVVYSHLKKISPISDEEFRQKIEEIFDNYKSRTKQNGAAIDSYSGVFNVRNVTRNDYKYFRAANRAGHAKQYSKIHLNLFIDVSGSFCGNQDTVNKMLHELVAYEKKNKDFDFDLIWIGEFTPITEEGRKNSNGHGYISVEKRPKDKRYIVASGGNDVGPYVKQIFINCQKPESENYNIVLFDGDAFSDSADREKSKRNLKAFNVSNCTIISDPDNRGAIEKYCKNSKNIITTNYVGNLKANIELAFREATRI